MSVVMNEVSTLRANLAVALNSQEPDAALVDAARRRDPEAFKELVTRYGPRIFRLAQKITRNGKDVRAVDCRREVPSASRPAKAAPSIDKVFSAERARRLLRQEFSLLDAQMHAFAGSGNSLVDYLFYFFFSPPRDCLDGAQKRTRRPSASPMRTNKQLRRRSSAYLHIAGIPPPSPTSTRTR